MNDWFISIPDMAWGLHGIITNLVEAVLAAVFYSGLFEVSFDENALPALRVDKRMKYVFN